MTVDPHFQVVLAGRSILIKCDSDVIPKWYFNNTRLKIGSQKNPKVLKIRNSTKNNGGLYTCKGGRVLRRSLRKEVFLSDAQAFVVVIGKSLVFNQLCNFMKPRYYL